MNKVEENTIEEFHLGSHLLAIATIKKARKEIDETINQLNYMKKYLEPSIEALNREEQKIRSKIFGALDDKRITVDDLCKISPY